MPTLSQRGLLGCLVVVLFAWTCALSQKTGHHGITLLVWSIAQWMPLPLLPIRESLQNYSWQQWEANINNNNNNKRDTIVPGVNHVELEIPTVFVPDHATPDDVLHYLEQTYGTSWRDRPVLFQGLWSATELQDENRRLSLTGLLQESLTVPYFIDARIHGAITPDGAAPIGQIVYNISHGAPHKIGTQLLVKTYPELLKEVAPFDLVTRLFGNHFQPQHILGVGTTFGIFPATTTVPVFIAAYTAGTTTTTTTSLDPQQKKHADHGSTTTTTTSDNDKDEADDAPSKQQPPSLDTMSSPQAQEQQHDHRHNQPRTHLHCEPIGNIAVQLTGSKHWTLIDPEHSSQILPSLSPDGRAFFVSWAHDLKNVPHYQVTTNAGDAVWVPTWTWHQVDYGRRWKGEEEETQDDDNNNNDDNNMETTIAIGGSLFHFRPLEFLRRNPLYAVLIIPAMVKELLGVSTQ